jgi:hypothetical protein
MKDFLMRKIWHENFDFEPEILSRAYKPDNHFGTKKILEMGQSF